MRIRYAVGSLAALAALPMLAPRGQPTHEQAGTAGLRKWTIVFTTGPVIRAEAVTTTSVVVPYFESVQLVRLNNGVPVICGSFGPPVLGDNGVERSWRYEAAKALSGPCAGGRGRYVAVGRRAGVDLSTPAVP